MLLRASGIVVGILVGLGGAGALAYVAWSSFSGYHGSFYPWDVLEPAIGAVFVILVAVLIALPAANYERPAVRITGFAVGFLLGIAGLFGIALAIMTELFESSGIGPNVYPWWLALPTVLLSFSASTVLAVKALRGARSRQSSSRVGAVP